MTENKNTQKAYEELIKSIVSKVKIVGCPDDIDSFDLTEINNCSIEKLKMIEAKIRKRFYNYNFILKFFAPLNILERKSLELSSDMELEMGHKIILNCYQKAGIYEEQQGIEVDNMECFLTPNEKKFFKILFSYHGKRKRNVACCNVDEKEEYLTSDEVAVMYNDNNVDTINKELKLNIQIIN